MDHAYHPVRAEVSRWFNDAGTGHAGGVRIYDCAVRVQLAGQQLPATCRMDRLGLSRVFARGFS